MKKIFLLVLFLAALLSQGALGLAQVDAAVTSAFFTVPNNLTYNEFALLYSVQGIVNKGGQPRLFLNTGELDLDFPESDLLWKKYFEAQRSVGFESIDNLCNLLGHFRSQFNGVVLYNETDGYTLYLAMTYASLNSTLPMSNKIFETYQACLKLPVRYSLGGMFEDKFSMYRWAIDTLLPQASKTVVWNADNYPNAVAQAKFTTIMSVDYAISQGAFVMNLCPLWKCQPKLCGTTRKATPKETELFVEIVEKSDDLVSVFGWSDPEYSYTNVTSHAGGAVFCSFSSPNLSFWDAISKFFRVSPVKLPNNDLGRELDPEAVYLMFETNEGDTPRILTSQFTSAWVSPNRGIVPVAWAIDPYLGELFPELYNFYASNTTVNDTFVNGLDGAGYVYLNSLGEKAAVYQARAGKVMSALGANVVDVGVAMNKWPASKIELIQEYAINARKSAADRRSPEAFLNACGTSYGQGINICLEDGTPVINSVCEGPKGNDTTNGHYLYYYRDHLDKKDPVGDFVEKVRWAASHYKKPGEPLFLLAYGGLGLYGGHDDFFLFVQRVMDDLKSSGKFVVVGAQELVRMAKKQCDSKIKHRTIKVRPQLSLSFRSTMRLGQGFGHSGDGCIMAREFVTDHPVLSPVFFDANAGRIKQTNVNLERQPTQTLTNIGRFDVPVPTAWLLEYPVNASKGALPICRTGPMPDSYCKNGSRVCPQPLVSSAILGLYLPLSWG